MNQINLDLSKPTQDIYIDSDGEYSAVFVGKGDQSISTRINLIHSKPNLKSRVSIKAVLYDRSKLDVEAVLVIEKSAYNTDTYLKIDCLLVGENASARAVPSLEISQDQVKAGHGATAGSLDPSQVHYLLSRGLDQSAAQQVLIAAFLEN